MLIKLAGITIELEHTYSLVAEMCRNYESVGAVAPAFRVCVTAEDIEYERMLAERIDIAEGREPFNHSNGYLEAIAVYRKILTEFASMNRVMFHSSAISIDGKGYMFAAKSGVGKSTFTRNLRKVLGDDVLVINDDKPIIEASNTESIIYGTPWDGKHHLSNNTHIPLKSIFFVERSEEPWIREVEPIDILKDFIEQTYLTKDSGKANMVLETLNRIGKNVKFYRMGITLDTRTAELFTKMIISE